MSSSETKRGPSETDAPARRERSFEEHFYGAATVGERGQIVIPAEARKKYGIETGDKLLIMGTPSQKGLMLCKIDDVRDFMTMFLEGLRRVESEYNEDRPEDQRIEP